MVGWYHTHPDWGVFLSGMDMFICDNFFNKKLDVAYVIDPCRGDRGMFQWTGDARHRVRRTGGFFVTASRFRAAELEYYVAELSSNHARRLHVRVQPPVPRPRRLCICINREIRSPRGRTGNCGGAGACSFCWWP